MASGGAVRWRGPLVTEGPANSCLLRPRQEAKVDAPRMGDAMLSGPPTGHSATHPLVPVAEGSRIDVLDVLRGFALFGVLLANLTWYFSGYGDLGPDEATRLPTAAVDPVVLWLGSFFVDRKFISIFCFLFGVGFALQMRRASGSGTGVRRLYVRRMLWLFVCGVAHALLIWYGDILHLYAVLGLLLIGWVARSDRALVGWGLTFALLIPVAAHSVLWGLPILTEGSVDPAAAFSARWKAAAALKVAFVHGSYTEVIRANVADVWAWLSTDDALTTGLASFGKLLLGFWVGRTSILDRASASPAGTEHPSSTVTLMRRGFVWGLALGVVCQGITLADSFVPAAQADSLAARVGEAALWQIGVLALAASYVCGIVLLFRRPACRGFLRMFAPVGRMALTNYIGQSVICIYLFYGCGLGWYGSVGPTAALGVALVVFTAQALVSARWLRLFRFGPAEWVWRSLTYGHRQPLRLRPAA